MDDRALRFARLAIGRRSAAVGRFHHHALPSGMTPRLVATSASHGCLFAATSSR
jgi:hypothetical protein